MSTERQEKKAKKDSTEGHVAIVELKHPVVFGKKTITEVVIYRRPKVKDTKGLSLAKQTTDDQIILLSRISNLVPPEIEMLDMQDWVACAEVLGDFLTDGQTT